MERTFGVEIETIGATKRAVIEAVSSLGIAICEEGYNHQTRRHWKIVPDASVTRYGGFEVVSPIMKGESGLEEVRKVADAIFSVGGTVDSHCGLHVHIGTKRGLLTAANVKKIVERYAAHEVEIDDVMPISRRANNNRIYCASVRGAVASRIVNSECDNLDYLSLYMSSRMHKVNLKALDLHGTVEFRHHSGSTESTKIVNWIKFLLNFVERSVQLTGAASITRSISGGSPRPGTKRALVLEGIRTGLTVGAIATLTGKTIENIIWTVNCIGRDYGMTFVKHGRYLRPEHMYWTIDETAPRQTVATEEVNDRSAFDGLSDDVKAYFRSRSEKFARQAARRAARSAA